MEAKKKSTLEQAIEDVYAGRITQEEFDKIMKAEASKRVNDLGETSDTKTKDDLLKQMTDFKQGINDNNEKRKTMLSQLTERIKIMFEGTMTYNNKPVKVRGLKCGDIVLEFSDEQDQKNYFKKLTTK